MEDKKIIALIRAEKREKPIALLYKEYPKIEAHALQMGLSKEVAQEIFNDSLILLIEKVENPQFVISSKLSTFLYGINHFLAKNELKKQHKISSVEWTEVLEFSDHILEYDFDKEEKLKRMETVLTQISEKCQRIFHLFYFERKSMDAIAAELKYTNTNSAKTQKYKCIEHAIALSKRTPNLTETSISTH
jgi:RNA polymerase sigma factor (sigma-70 family)